MDELFTIIGKMYVDLVQSQKVITELQKNIEEKDKDIGSLQKAIIDQQTEQK